MHAQNHGHLRERLARTASQKRLGLFMRGIAFFAHKSLRHPDVIAARLNKPEAILLISAWLNLIDAASL